MIGDKKSLFQEFYAAMDDAFEAYSKLKDGTGDTLQTSDGPRYAGNKVCPSCGDRKGLSSFHKLGVCGACYDNAAKLFERLEKLCDGENVDLVPNREEYIEAQVMSWIDFRENHIAFEILADGHIPQS